MKKLIVLFVILLFGCTEAATKTPDEVNIDAEMLELFGESSDNLVGMAANAKLKYVSCTDSDGSDFNFQGTTKAVVTKGGKRLNVARVDKCVGKNSVKEYYCSKKRLLVASHICPGGCTNGKCIVKPFCGDSLCADKESCTSCPTDCMKGACCDGQEQKCTTSQGCEGLDRCINTQWTGCNATQACPACLAGDANGDGKVDSTDYTAIRNYLTNPINYKCGMDCNQDGSVTGADINCVKYKLGLSLDLANYPNMFITDGQYNGYLVIGHDAPAQDTIALTNIALGLQRALSTGGQAAVLPSTVNKFDTEMNNPNVNMITIGNPCQNTMTALTMGSSQCDYMLGGNAAILYLKQFNNSIHLAVYGSTGQNTVAASRVLQNYEQQGLFGQYMYVAIPDQDVAVCPNAKCEASESCSTCPEDCGGCPVAQVKIETGSDHLELNELLSSVKPTLAATDLPRVLKDGSIDESNYKQTLNLLSGAVRFTQDDNDAPDANEYLKLSKSIDLYRYDLKFDIPVTLSGLIGQPIEILGKTYQIMSAQSDSLGNPDKLVLLGGVYNMWMAQGETITRKINGVDHTIAFRDVAEGIGKNVCLVLVDGVSVAIDVGDIETVSGVTIGALDARMLPVDSNADICKLAIGAYDITIEDTYEIETNGDEIDGSKGYLIGSAGKLEAIRFDLDPEQDVYLERGNSFVDPVFNGFEIIYAGLSIENVEEIGFGANGNSGSLNFINSNRQPIQVPFFYDGELKLAKSGSVDDKMLTVGDSCNFQEGEIVECEGIGLYLAPRGVARILEITELDFISQKIYITDITNNQDVVRDYNFGYSNLTVGDAQILLYITNTSLEFTAYNDPAWAETSKGAKISFTPEEITVVTELKEANDQPDTIKASLSYENGIMVAGVTGLVTYDQTDSQYVGRSDYGVGLSFNQNGFGMSYPDTQAYAVVFVREG